jgi:hypothetical protein
LNSLGWFVVIHFFLSFQTDERKRDGRPWDPDKDSRRHLTHVSHFDLPFFLFLFFLNSFISVFLLCVCFTEETHKNKRIDSRSAVCVCVLYSPKSISISHVSRIGHEMKIFSLLFLFEFCIFSFYFKKKKKKNPAPGPGTDSAYGGHGQPYTHMHLLSLNI